MIGTVRDLEPIVPIQVLDAHGQWWWFEAVLDTGATCDLTLPYAIIERLGLQWLQHGGASLAGGASVRSDLYAGEILWDGARQGIFINALEGDPLIGNRLLEGHRITIDLIEGGVVDVAPLMNQPI